MPEPRLPKGEPILIPCEGSMQKGHLVFAQSEELAMCAMCGKVLPTTSTLVPEHTRDDILARLQRGDFG